MADERTFVVRFHLTNGDVVVAPGEHTADEVATLRAALDARVDPHPDRVTADGSPVRPVRSFAVGDPARLDRGAYVNAEHVCRITWAPYKFDALGKPGSTKQP